MKPELREKIIAYNKAVKEKGDKATDMDIILVRISRLPPGQLKKVLDKETIAVFQKYGLLTEE